ncbi:MAG: ABC transporter ATP-binding protein [Bacteroidetes bacterium HGW-Bacteroidetes-15]|nr:MAG: ABC transporter ATP-binding protein [Bacteroidetes bacterium HGW-Bacteroidetes-15]
MLDVRNLSVAFGSKPVLEGLSFSLALGESLGIVGESGSGKSITALSLMGLLPPGAKIVSGIAELTINPDHTLDLLNLTESHHRRVRGSALAMIFQEPMTSLNPSMRCGRQVEEAIKLHQKVDDKTSKQKCLSLLSEMQLPDPGKVYKSYPHQLSGGQKQRVMIAMALAGNPSILIADEPTTALDVTVQKEIISLLKKIGESRGMSLIFISHDLGVISEITDQLIVLKDGVLVESGKTKNLLTHPNHPYTKGLIACRPPLNTRPVILPTVQQFLANHDANIEPNNISQKEFQLINDKIYAQEPLLSIDGVSVEFTLNRNFLGKPTKVFSAVNNLSFNLYPTETLGLVGESGCGKTTLGRAILGLVGYSQGSITYKGTEIRQMNTDEMQNFRKEVQLVFQDPYSSLNPRHTIGETLMEPLEFHKIVSGKTDRKKRVLDLLEQVSLTADSFYRYPHEFSGGQRQRIAIARALALNPKVIVCDEMVSALDVSVQAQILNLLNQLKKDFGLTYIFISHDLSVVKYMSNRMLVMQNGQSVEYGYSDDIYSNPMSNYTTRLINAIPGKLD